MDQFVHWTKYNEEGQRGKQLSGWKGYTYFKYEQSGVHICLTKDENDSQPY